MLSDEEFFKETFEELQECQNNGGILAQSAPAATSYIFGNILKEIINDQDKSVAQRNYNWISRLNKYLSENPEGTLVTVGLGHLFGSEVGLIPYYYEHGWKVEQVNISSKFFEIDMETL